MLPERANRYADAASIEISAADFFAPRMVTLLRQASQYRRAAALSGKPLNTRPQTLTGDEWRAAWAEARDAATDRALDVIY